MALQLSNNIAIEFSLELIVYLNMQAQSRMQELMKDGYRLDKNEVCHVAQERLRKDMGIMSEEGSSCVLA